MGERKHKVEGGEKKAIQPQREEERQSEKQPPEALKRMAKDVARPADIQALQRTIGNKAVTNMIQKIRSAQVRTVAPGTIQRHLTTGQNSQAHRAVARHRAAATQGSAGMRGTLASTTNWRAGAHESWEAFNDLAEVVEAAIGTQAGEGSGQSQ